MFFLRLTTSIRVQARGYKELPPHTSGSHAVPSSGGGEQQLPRPGPGPSSGSGDKFDIRKMMDVKSSVPLLAPAPPPATPPPPQLDSDKTAAAAGDKAAGVSKAAAAGPVPAPPLTRSSASASKPPTAPSSSEVPGPKSSPGLQRFLKAAVGYVPCVLTPIYHSLLIDS